MYDLTIRRSKEIEDLAVEVLRHSVGFKLPVSTDGILERCAILVYSLDQAKAAEFKNVEAAFDMRKPPYSLFLPPISGGQNPIGYRHRIRFTHGHEIGHFILHKDMGIVFRESHTERKKAAERRDIPYCNRENEADAFAASLLLPEHIFSNDLPKENNPHADPDGWRKLLTTKYNVSRDSLDRRIAWLRQGHVITGEAFADSHQIAWVFPSRDLEKSKPALAKAVWHANDVVPGSRPAFLPKRVLDGFYSENGAWRWEDTLRVDEVLPDTKAAIRCDMLVLRQKLGRVQFYMLLPY